MDHFLAFLKGEANRGKTPKVFDWKKAAKIIVDNKKPSRILDISQFKINKEKSASGRKLSRGEPVKWRGNLWVDDGITEKGGVENITPKVKPVPRTRAKYEKVSIECKECKEHVVVDQIHVRENFVCDSCIESKRKRVSRSS